MAQYDVYYRGSQSHVERVERVEANSVLEAQVKLRDSFREEEVQALIFDAVLVQEEAEEDETLNNIINKIENKIKTYEMGLVTNNTYDIASLKGKVTGLREALEIIKQYEE